MIDLSVFFQLNRYLNRQYWDQKAASNASSQPSAPGNTVPAQAPLNGEVEYAVIAGAVGGDSEGVCVAFDDKILIIFHHF